MLSQLFNNIRNMSENFAGILTKNFEKEYSLPISFSHFLPYTKFQRCSVSYPGLTNPTEKWKDLSNGDLYRLDNLSKIRLQFLQLSITTPIVHAIGLLLNVANRVAKIFSLAHFWHSSSAELPLIEKGKLFGKDLMQIAFSPIIYLGLELSALYGMILPNNGRKLYATFERYAYGDTPIFSLCFQPEKEQTLVALKK